MVTVAGAVPGQSQEPGTLLWVAGVHVLGPFVLLSQESRKQKAGFKVEQRGLELAFI